jgi:hypothetical protein
MPRGSKPGPRAQRVAVTERACPKCGALHTCNRLYCLPCWRSYQSGWRARSSSTEGTPPPPPEGFDTSDLENGKPYT